MKKITIILSSFLLITMLTTFNPESFYLKLHIFEIRKIEIINNKILKKDKLLNLFYSELESSNLFFLKNEKVTKILNKNKIIERVEIKKIYPNKLLVKIYEKTPIAIINNKNGRFYLMSTGEEIKYFKILTLDKLPNIFSRQENFLQVHRALKRLNFPISEIKSFYYFDIGRWDIIMKNKKIIKLPIKNFTESIENFIQLNNELNFKNYKIFDYRIKDQLILN